MLLILLNSARQDYFDCDLPSVMIEKRRKTFLACFEIVEKPCVSLYMNCYYKDTYWLRFS